MKVSPLCVRVKMPGLLTLSWPLVGALLGVLLTAPQSLAREVVRFGESSKAPTTYLKKFTMPGVTPRQVSRFVISVVYVEM